MPTSYSGRWITVDLSSGRIEEHRVSRSVLESFLGGRGVGARELWDFVSPVTNPLDAGNALIFAPGVLTGTSAPCSGRTTILAKGPATNRYLKSNVGGHFGIALKMAGIDGVIFTGRAQYPVYLFLTPDKHQLRSARNLWGQGVVAVTRTLKERYGNDVEIACIGPAGERLVKFAAIMASTYNAAARGGIGAVMGSKNLKAVVVDSFDGQVEVADVFRFGQVTQRARDKLYQDSLAYDLHRFGTARDIDILNELRLLPAFNFQRSHLAGDVHALSGRAWPDLGLLKRIVGCGGCIYSCHRFTRVNDGPYAGTYSGGPEYETVAAFGSGCGLFDPEPVFAANALCNDLGMDTISTGSVIQWAMECYERGVLSQADCDGVKLQFGDGEAVVNLVRKIGYRKGFGDLLADGVAHAAAKVGQGSERWAMHVHGLEQSNVETRGSYGYALAFAVNPRGPDHLHTECLAEFGGTKEGVALIERLLGDAKYAQPNLEDKRADIVRWHEDIYAVSDALGLCAFATTAAYGIDEQLAAELFSAATGIEMDATDIMRAGRRIVTLERCFNIREGPSDDRLPWRIMHEPQRDLSPGEPISRQKLERMLQEYYRLHGWSVNGRPQQEILRSLGLDFVLKEAL